MVQAKSCIICIGVRVRGSINWCVLESSWSVAALVERIGLGAKGAELFQTSNLVSAAPQRAGSAPASYTHHGGHDRPAPARAGAPELGRAPACCGGCRGDLRR